MEQLTNYPYGVSSFGVPLFGTTPFPTKMGRVLFVDAENGSDDNPGSNATLPLETCQEAIDKCTSAAGDIIFVYPGSYEENLDVTGKDYVTMIGVIAAGYARPDIAPSTGKALLIDDSQGFVANHIRFYSSDSDGVYNEGNGFLFYDCVFDGDSGQAATEANLRLVGDAADDSYSASEGKIINCYFRGSNGFGLLFQHAAAPSGVGVSDVEVLGCRFVANAVDIGSATNTTGGGTGIFLNLLIKGNYFLSSEDATYIDMDQGAAGDLAANNALITDNHFADEALIASQCDISGQPKVHFNGNWDDAGIVNGAAFNN